MLGRPGLPTIPGDKRPLANHDGGTGRHLHTECA
jgi:hypothetical protein